MRLQSVIIPQNAEYPEMYFRGDLSFPAGDTLTLDTYFNSFSYTKYRDYTSAQRVTFSCQIRGRARLSLCVFDGEERIIREDECGGDAAISAELSELPENGFLYPKLTALTDCCFICGEYSSDRLPADISVCAAVCTYKREDYVLRNIERLRSAEFSFLNRVFVIDNGGTLDKEALSQGIITVLSNRNYGGSGGFTRGLLEALDGGYSHVILMDDDIDLHPEILERMTAFAAILHPEHKKAHFGTAMLSDSNPCIQYELGGANWNGRRVCFVKHNIDIRPQRTLLENLSGNDIGYGAWWCFMMPASDIAEYGLPYPFFIKIDDVEYGLRTCKTSPIITMNGIAVRHEDFDNKYSMHLEYYNVRNQLVMNAAHNNRPTLNALYRLFAASFKQLVLYRYDSMPLILRAFNDYLRGVDFFLSCDEEKLNRELIQSAPECIPLDEISGWNEQMRSIPRTCDNKVLTPAALLTMAGHLIPSFLLKKDTSAAPLSRAGACDTLFRSTVVQYQLAGNSGIVTKRSFAKYVRYSFKVLAMAVKLLFLNPRVSREYRRRAGEITSAEFWRRHLGLIDER